MLSAIHRGLPDFDNGTRSTRRMPDHTWVELAVNVLPGAACPLLDGMKATLAPPKADLLKSV